MKKLIVLILFITSSLTSVYSQVQDTIALSLDFPLVDLPYQIEASKSSSNFLKSFASPSMNQSLHASTDFYSAINYGAKKLIKTKNKKLNFVLSQALAGGFDYLVNTLPLGVAWNHEEFHRAVMTKNGISSYNEVYEMNLFAPAIFVSQVTDEDLANLNDNHSADFRRLMSAGSESSIAQIQLLQKNNFYNNSALPNIVYYWLSTLGNAGYIKYSSSELLNDEIATETLAEGTDISARDFTGPDFSAWAYALFEPEVGYSERGPHPSGVGIDRAIAPNELSHEARNYLNRQGNLSYLNLLSPHMIGFNKFKLFTNAKGNHYGNIALRHTLTPFGNDISVDLFYQTPTNKLFGTIHTYNNHSKHFIGLEVGIVDKEFLANKMLLSATAMLWQQPEDQSFYATKGQTGGMLKAKAFYSYHKLKPYLEVALKSKGWVSSNVYLEENLGLNFGFRVDF